MRKLNATIDGKHVASWMIPESAEEIEYRQLIMYGSAYEKFLQVKNKQLKDYLPVMSAFFDTDTEAIRSLPMRFFPGFEKQATGLFLYITELMVAYEPKIRKGVDGDAVIEYDGDTWLIPSALHANEADITFGQAIDLMDIQRKAKIEAENRPDDVDDITYTSGLSTLAVLLKKQGEELPEDDIQLKTLINKRIHRFAKMDMVTALDCIFFLRRGKSVSLKTAISPGYLTRQALTTVLRRRRTLLRSVGRQAS